MEVLVFIVLNVYNCVIDSQKVLVVTTVQFYRAKGLT